MSPRVMHSVVGSARPSDARRDEGTARLHQRLLEIISRGPGRQEGLSLVQALRIGSGALHVASLRIEELGSRAFFMSTKPGSAVGSIPASLVSTSGAESVRTALDRNITWTAVTRGDSLLIAAFEEEDIAGEAVFALVGPACATFLAKCASSAMTPDSAWAMLGAVSSLFHDTLNVMTGLSLCLGAYRQNRLAGRKATCEEEAVLDRTLVSLESLCGEYTRMARASRSHTMSTSGRVMMLSYVDVLKEFTIDVEKVQLSRDFRLSASRRGIALRALMNVAAGLLQVGGTRVRVRATASRGVARVSVSFISEAPAAVVAADQAFAEGVELVNSRGGCAVLALRRGAGRVTISFADGCTGGKTDFT